LTWQLQRVVASQAHWIAFLSAGETKKSSWLLFAWQA
jgi:hypothetical protein